MLERGQRNTFIRDFFSKKGLVSYDLDEFRAQVTAFLHNNPRIDTFVSKSDQCLAWSCQLFWSNSSVIERIDNLPLAFFMEHLFNNELCYAWREYKNLTSDEFYMLRTLDVLKSWQKELLFCEIFAFGKALSGEDPAEINGVLLPDDMIEVVSKFSFFPFRESTWHVFFIARYIRNAFSLNVDDNDFRLLLNWIQQNKNNPKYDQLWEFVCHMFMVTLDFASLKKYIIVMFQDCTVPRADQEAWLLSGINALLWHQKKYIYHGTNALKSYLMSTYERSKLEEYRHLTAWMDRILLRNEKEEREFSRDCEMPISALFEIIDEVSEQWKNVSFENPVLNTLRLSVPKQLHNPAFKLKSGFS